MILKRLFTVKGISLNIGLNNVDPNHYGGWNGQLAGCENDANDMANIAATAGLDVTKLLTQEATVENVTKRVQSAAHVLEPSDYFLLTYSGHGGQLRDENKDEEDFLDETWCLYDRQFVDDELICLRYLNKDGSNSENERLIKDLLRLLDLKDSKLVVWNFQNLEEVINDHKSITFEDKGFLTDILSIPGARRKVLKEAKGRY